MGIFKSFLVFITLAVNFAISAQEIIVSQPTSGDPIGGSLGIGQSFTAPSDTNMLAIAVLPWNDSTVTLSVFDNAMATGTPIYTQTGINLVAAATTDPLQIITLNTAVPLTAGQSYSFVFSGVPMIQLYMSGGFLTPINSYSGGTILYKDNLPDYVTFPAADLAFQIYGPSKPVVAAPKAIPSLSVFGLLSLMMLVIAWVVKSRNIQL